MIFTTSKEIPEIVLFTWGKFDSNLISSNVEMKLLTDTVICLKMGGERKMRWFRNKEHEFSVAIIIEDINSNPARKEPNLGHVFLDQL